MPTFDWLDKQSPAFRLMIATSWLAPGSWRNEQEKAIREAVEAGVDWNEYLNDVKGHRTPALSWAALSGVAGIDVPSFVQQELRTRTDACRMEAVRHSMFLADLLQNFSRAEIPVMPLKGLMLSWELYEDIGLRQANDLDIAVAQQDVDRAQACLQKRGWVIDSSWAGLTPLQWQSVLRNGSQIVFTHSVSGLVLELHWRHWWATPDQTRAQWARTVPATWQGCSFIGLNSTDMMLYLCSHGAQHLWCRAKWLGDLARACALGRVNWQEVLRESRRTGQERVLLSGLLLVNQLYGLPLPGSDGSTWGDLPDSLLNVPLQALLDPDQSATEGLLTSSRKNLRRARYNRLLRPQKSWWASFSEFIHHREDFETIRLPDRLFWMYLPLRPFLWAWRRFR